MGLTVRRVADLFYAAVFGFHLIIMCAFDFQALFGKYYPQLLRDVLESFGRKYKECFFLNPPEWFVSFLVVEVVLCVPCQLCAIYAFIKGVKKCPWIRIPSIMYCVFLCTITLAYLTETYFKDFSKDGYTTPCPKTTNERLTLIAIAAPMVAPCIFMAIDMWLIVGDTPTRGNNAPTKNQQKKKAAAKKTQ